MPWKGYEEAGKKYAPSAVNLLFVAEAPPAARERYFYFPDVPEHDHLWVGLMKALYPSDFGEVSRERPRKRDWLKRFQSDGCMLVDALKDPIPKGLSPTRTRFLLREQKDALVAEIRRISPRQVLPIKATVYDALYTLLKDAGLPVIDGRLPFPGSGRQTEFHDRFRRLIEEGKLIPPNALGD